MESHKMHVPNHQPEYLLLTMNTLEALFIKINPIGILDYIILSYKSNTNQLKWTGMTWDHIPSGIFFT